MLRGVRHPVQRLPCSCFPCLVEACSLVLYLWWYIHSDFKDLKKLSATALSQQLPFRLILCLTFPPSSLPGAVSLPLSFPLSLPVTFLPPSYHPDFTFLSPSLTLPPLSLLYATPPLFLHRVISLLSPFRYLPFFISPFILVSSSSISHLLSFSQSSFTFPSSLHYVISLLSLVCSLLTSILYVAFLSSLTLVLPPSSIPHRISSCHYYCIFLSSSIMPSPFSHSYVTSFPPFFTLLFSTHPNFIPPFSIPHPLSSCHSYFTSLFPPFSHPSSLLLVTFFLLTLVFTLGQ